MHSEVSRRVLEVVDIIRLTTTRLAKNALILRSLNVKVVLYKEATKVLEAYILTTFIPSVQHLILIRDYK